jgi:hypothetical protein
MTTIGEILTHSCYPISRYVDYASSETVELVTQYARLRESKELSKVERCFMRGMEGLFWRQHQLNVMMGWYVPHHAGRIALLTHSVIEGLDSSIAGSFKNALQDASVFEEDIKTYLQEMAT